MFVGCYLLSVVSCLACVVRCLFVDRCLLFCFAFVVCGLVLGCMLLRIACSLFCRVVCSSSYLRICLVNIVCSLVSALCWLTLAVMCCL